MRHVLAAFLTVAAVLGSVSSARAQQIKGPTTCFKCHKPLAKQVWEVDAAFHKKSVDQLSGPKAAAYAAAVGLASPTAVTGKGDCVSCHATVVGGAPSVGISCESCHGPASGYFAPHQEPEFYAKPEAEWLGLRNLYNKPAAIAALCVNCHVTTEPRLKKAGHPVGDAFDAGKAIQKMVHWDSGTSTNRKRTGYGPATYAAIGAESPKLVAKRLASAGPALAAAGPAAPPAKPAAGTAAPAASQPAAPNAPAGTAAPAPSKPRPASNAKPDPFDWDQPVQELPADYPGDTAPAATTAPAKASAPAPRPVAPAPPPKAPPAPSTAAEVPALPEAPVVPAQTPAPPPPPSAAPSAAGGPPVARPRPTQPAAQVAELRGRSASVLAGLLKQKRGSLEIPAPAAPSEYDGPDGELLRLQDEILYLALDALRKPRQ